MNNVTLIEIPRIGIQIRAPKLMDPQPWASFDGYAEWRRTFERRALAAWTRLGVRWE